MILNHLVQRILICFLYHRAKTYQVLELEYKISKKVMRLGFSICNE